MNRVKTLLIVAVFVVISPGFGGRPAFAQDARQTPPREADPIAALTAEFRALRAELSAAAAASLRLQLLVARLQAQEQRVLYFDRLRSEAATKRQNAEQARSALASQMQMVDPAEASKRDPEERRAIESVMKQLKTQLTIHERTVQQMQIEETDAANALTQEQGRWNDFNARLDELERSLSQR